MFSIHFKGPFGLGGKRSCFNYKTEAGKLSPTVALYFLAVITELRIVGFTVLFLIQSKRAFLLTVT